MVMKILVYTHTDVDWVWPYWYKQTDKYLSNFKKVMFVNNATDINKDYNCIEYDDNLKYTERVASCLNQMDDEEIVIFQHEDMFLYDSPDLDVLFEFKELVKLNKVHLIKLLRNGDTLTPSNLHSSLYLSPNNLFFSIQPTICKVKTLKHIFSTTQGETMWEFETNAMNSPLRSQYTSCFCYDGGKKRGRNHWDGKIYPYIATALTKGKWNKAEYKQELDLILSS